jgi:hypothetical protein
MTKAKGTGNDALDQLLDSFGYAYDAKQDIFYSTLDAWQRDFGYFRLYDEAAALFSMIMDCEPIYFSYAGKRWLIQFWKGQYGITTGCEVGVYNTTQPDLHIPGIFKGPFFHSVDDENLLHISCTLYKNGEPLFCRKDVHWWVTGFILGAFSEPSDLMADIEITLKDTTMRNAFLEGLMEAGYHQDELLVNENTVCLTFAEPRTPQPFTRNPISDTVVQARNKLLAEMYRQITAPFTDIVDKFQALEEKAPELTAMIGKNRPLYQRYDLVRKQIE